PGGRTETFAEIDPEEKHRISHRANAFAKLVAEQFGGEGLRGARALYIHWPFCLKKCPYCDFNSHVRDGVDVPAWRDALLADMRHEAALAGGETLESVFFGGGTPSLMPPELVAALLAEAERLWG